MTLEWVTHNVNRAEGRRQTENLTLVRDVTVFTAVKTVTYSFTSADHEDHDIFNYRMNSPDVLQEFSHSKSIDIHEKRVLKTSRDASMTYKPCNQLNVGFPCFHVHVDYNSQ